MDPTETMVSKRVGGKHHACYREGKEAKNQMLGTFPQERQILPAAVRNRAQGTAVEGSCFEGSGA